MPPSDWPVVSSRVKEVLLKLSDRPADIYQILLQFPLPLACRSPYIPFSRLAPRLVCPDFS